jgi:hypothetical protein
MAVMKRLRKARKRVVACMYDWCEGMVCRRVVGWW